MTDVLDGVSEEAAAFEAPDDAEVLDPFNDDGELREDMTHAELLNHILGGEYDTDTLSAIRGFTAARISNRVGEGYSQRHPIHHADQQLQFASQWMIDVAKGLRQAPRDMFEDKVL